MYSEMSNLVNCSPEIKKLSRVINVEINNLLDVIEARVKNDKDVGTVVTLRRRISLLRSAESNEYIAIKLSNILVRCAERIAARKAEDESFIVSFDARSRYEGRLSAENKFIIEVIELVQQQYSTANEVDKNYIYKTILQLCHHGAEIFKREPSYWDDSFDSNEEIQAVSKS